MLHRAVILLVTAAALVLAAACSSGGSTEKEPAPLGGLAADVIVRMEPRPIAEFELIDQDGQPFSFHGADGSVRLFYFGYTGCPDICPTTMVDWRDTKRLLGDEAAGVKFIMVTVDPPNDTPEVLKRFLANFDPAFMGLSGSEQALASVWERFGVKVRRLDLPQSATGHSISHSASVYAVNRSGDLVMKFTFDAEPEDIAEGVRELLDES